MFETSAKSCRFLQKGTEIALLKASLSLPLRCALEFMMKYICVMAFGELINILHSRFALFRIFLLKFDFIIVCCFRQYITAGRIKLIGTYFCLMWCNSWDVVYILIS